LTFCQKTTATGEFTMVLVSGRRRREPLSFIDSKPKYLKEKGRGGRVHPFGVTHLSMVPGRSGRPTSRSVVVLDAAQRHDARTSTISFHLLLRFVIDASVQSNDDRRYVK
jgi:hypothetical protein